MFQIKLDKNLVLNYKEIDMGFRLAHLNFNVTNLKASMEFYDKLGMKEVRRHAPDDGSFVIVFLEDSNGSDFKLELTWMRDHPEKYDLGEEEFHLGFYVSDYEKVKQEHKDKGLICYNTDGKGYHFILDPDGYWLEFFPEK
jgi:lactoylglutathione lyase